MNDKIKRTNADQVEKIAMWRIYVGKCVIILLFWLPFFIALSKEVRRAWFNFQLINQIKHEYKIWKQILLRDFSVSKNSKVDKLHRCQRTPRQRVPR